MTFYEKLDRIMNGYLFRHQLVLKNDPDSKRLTFSMLVNTLCPDIEEWEKKYLRDQLISDGYLVSINEDFEQLEMTPTGILFNVEKGYVKTKNETEIDKQIKAETLKDLRRSRAALIISALAILISALNAYFTHSSSGKNPTNEDYNSLLKKVETLEKQVSKDGKISEDPTSSDTLTILPN